MNISKILVFIILLQLSFIIAIHVFKNIKKNKIKDEDDEINSEIKNNNEEEYEYEYIEYEEDVVENFDVIELNADNMNINELINIYNGDTIDAIDKSIINSVISYTNKNSEYVDSITRKLNKDAYYESVPLLIPSQLIEVFKNDVYWYRNQNNISFVIKTRNIRNLLNIDLYVNGSFVEKKKYAIKLDNIHNRLILKDNVGESYISGNSNILKIILPNSNDVIIYTRVNINSLQDNTYVDNNGVIVERPQYSPELEQCQIQNFQQKPQGIYYLSKEALLNMFNNDTYWKFFDDNNEQNTFIFKIRKDGEYLNLVLYQNNTILTNINLQYEFDNTDDIITYEMGNIDNIVRISGNADILVTISGTQNISFVQVLKSIPRPSDDIYNMTTPPPMQNTNISPEIICQVQQTPSVTQSIIDYLTQGPAPPSPPLTTQYIEQPPPPPPPPLTTQYIQPPPPTTQYIQPPPPPPPPPPTQPPLIIQPPPPPTQPPLIIQPPPPPPPPTTQYIPPPTTLAPPPQNNTNKYFILFKDLINGQNYYLRPDETGSYKNDKFSMSNSQPYQYYIDYTKYLCTIDGVKIQHPAKNGSYTYKINLNKDGNYDVLRLATNYTSYIKYESGKTYLDFPDRVNQGYWKLVDSVNEIPYVNSNPTIPPPTTRQLDQPYTLYYISKGNLYFTVNASECNVYKNDDKRYPMTKYGLYASSIKPSKVPVSQIGIRQDGGTYYQILNTSIYMYKKDNDNRYFIKKLGGDFISFGNSFMDSNPSNVLSNSTQLSNHVWIFSTT